MSLSPYDLSMRQTWMDTLRGCAVVFVILFHLHLLFIKGLPSHPFFTALSVFIEAVGPFRMEILYFLSGMLADRSMKKGWNPYLSGKIDRILWPYLVWTTVMLVVDYRTLPQILLPTIYGFSHLTWFLAFLFLYYLLAYIVREINCWIVLGLSYCLAIIFFITGSPIDRGFVNLWDIPYYFLYFVSGCHFVRSARAVAFARRDMTIFLGWLAGMAVICVAIVISPPTTHPAYFPFVLVSLPFWFWVVSSYGMQVLFSYVGRNSIYFFVMHFPIIILCKRYLVPQMPSSVVAPLVLTAVLSMGIPMITAFFADKSSLIKAFFVRPRSLLRLLPGGFPRAFRYANGRSPASDQR